MTRANGNGRRTSGVSTTVEEEGEKPPVKPDVVTVSIKDQATLDESITDAVARNLAIAQDAKDLTAAIKAAIEWRREKYGAAKSDDEKWGSKLKEGSDE